MTLRLAKPAPPKVWTQEAGTAVVRERGQGRCEGCGETSGLQFSHRIAASRGGTWAPSNGIRLDYKCHQSWAHAEPELARAAGWHLPTRADPAAVPAWLRAPYAGWWLLSDDGLLTPADRHEFSLPVLPPLPPWIDPWTAGHA